MLKGTNVIERRKAERLNIPLQVKYRLSLKKKTLMEEAFAKNISGGGICLTVTEPLRLGTKLKTQLYFPDDPKPITPNSKVVWCKKRIAKDKSYYDVGIEHLKIIPKDKERFVFLFCETMINYFLLPA